MHWEEVSEKHLLFMLFFWESERWFWYLWIVTKDKDATSVRVIWMLPGSTTGHRIILYIVLNLYVLGLGQPTFSPTTPGHSLALYRLSHYFQWLLNVTHFRMQMCLILWIWVNPYCCTQWQTCLIYIMEALALPWQVFGSNHHFQRWKSILANLILSVMRNLSFCNFSLHNQSLNTSSNFTWLLPNHKFSPTSRHFL